jgi:hypothetical protein
MGGIRKPARPATPPSAAWLAAALVLAVCFPQLAHAQAPEISLEPDTLEATLAFRVTGSRTLFVGNTGDVDLEWSATESADWLEIESTPSPVAPNHSTPVAVWFSADLPAGVYEEDIVIDSNDPVNPQTSVLARMVVEPKILVGVSDTAFAFGPGFVGLEETRTLTLSNDGNAPLDLTEVYVNSPAFVLGAVPASVPGQGTADFDVTFRPPYEGPFGAALVIVNNSENDDSVVVALSGDGIVAVDLQVLSPDSIAASVGQAAWIRASAWVANPSAHDQPMRVSSFVRDGGPAGAPAAGSTPVFFDNFEDLDLSGWTQTSGTGTREIALGGGLSNLAYHESGSPIGHRDGIYVALPDVRPRHVAFSVKPGQDDMFSSYVAIHDADGNEAVYFFAMGTGRFYVNANVGGDDSYPYEADRWYFIEYREIDWTDKTFDYYVEGRLVQADVSFRNPTLVDEFARLDLYNYSAGASAWWDDVWVDWGRSPEWLAVSPEVAVVEAGTIEKLQLRMASAGLEAGTYESYLGLRANNALEPLITIPVTLTVDSTVTGTGGGDAPAVTALHQNYPNPFNPATTIAFDLRENADVSLSVYDVAGALVRRLVSRRLPAGTYTSSWDGTDGAGRRVASGVYFYRLVAGDFTATRKMVLLK